MKVLLTGADGYIGVLAGPKLIEHGHEVVGLDAGLYRAGWLCNDGTALSPPCMTKDIREVTVDDLRGFDAVVHLAELSNDPLAELNPKLTFRINHEGSVQLARNARAAGVRRFVYTSSCSVYGAGDEEMKTEESETDPQTAYAECKVRVERDVSALADDDFMPTFLRNATAYGASPRMRFDIVLNNLAGHAWTTGVIRMTSDGTPWRPLVHVQDICEAIARVLDAPPEAVHDQVLNVGRNEDNYRIREVAEIVAAAFPGCELSIGDRDADSRSYRVSFDKIHERLPEFRCAWTAESGAKQLHDVFHRIDLSKDMFEFRPFTRLKQLKHLIETEQVDRDLFWSTT